MTSPINWTVYNSVEEIPFDLWNEKISCHNFGLDKRHMTVLEKVNTNYHFYYCLAYKNEYELVGIAFFCVCIYDLLNSIPKAQALCSTIRNFYPSFLKICIGMTATFETYGSHLWYSSQEWCYEQFITSFLNYIATKNQDYKLVVLRDYIGHEIDFTEKNNTELEVNKTLGFVNVDNFPIAKIVLNQTSGEYINKLKYKTRAYIRKIIRERNDAGLTIEIIKDFTPYLDHIYKLYVDVNTNAKEYHTACFSKEYFYEIKRQFNDSSKIVAVKSSDNKIIAFTLIFENENTVIPFLIGLDYTCNRQYNLWYHCIWETIMYSVDSGKEIIDLGITNYDMKCKLGAILFPMIFSVRIRNDFLNWIFKPVLPFVAK
jgi:Peptidogalycan biosysnthesis/recognition